MADYPRQKLIAWLKREAHSCSALYKDQIEAVAKMLEVDAEVRKAADALLTALDACKPRLDSAALLAHVHGFKASADSPTFHVELAALRALLRGEA